MSDKAKHLHLIRNDKFTEAFIDFINKNFSLSEHLFLIIGGVSEDKLKIKERENVKKISNSIGNLLILLKEMNRSKKIFLHGLSVPFVVVMLFMKPWLIKKCFWIIWGGDLYWYKMRPRGIKSDLYEFIRCFVIKRLGGLITQVKGDYDLAKKWYGASGKYYYSFMYPSNLYKEYDLSKINKDLSKTYILVGNSADPTNNHLEVFEKLKIYMNDNIEIICPLSYGNFEYKERVIREGVKIFGNKFFPIVEFMPFEIYLDLLAKIDVAIFNHNRQQALGNITTLLGLGKKIFIRDDITTWEFCSFHELKVFSFNKDLNDLTSQMTELEIANNINNVKRYFSETKLQKDLVELLK